MKRWRQGCALAACGHVPPPHIGDDGNACPFRDASRVADLKGEAVFGTWAMADRLTVAANRGDGGGRQANALEQRQHAVAEQAAKPHVGPPEAIDFVRARRAQFV